MWQHYYWSVGVRMVMALTQWKGTVHKSYEWFGGRGVLEVMSSHVGGGGLMSRSYDILWAQDLE